MTTDEIEQLVGTCVDGDTKAALQAARAVVAAYEELQRKVDRCEKRHKCTDCHHTLAALQRLHADNGRLRDNYNIAADRLNAAFDWAKGFIDTPPGKLKLEEEP